MFDRFAKIFLWVVTTAIVALVTSAGASRAAEAKPGTEWEGASGPAVVRPGESLTLRVRLRNTGRTLWEARGSRRAVLSAMVVDGNGSPWPGPEARAALSYPVPSGAATTCVIRITAPAAPGRYRALVGRGVWQGGKVELDPSPFSWTFEVRAKP